MIYLNKELFFSAKGRINRKPFILINLVLFIFVQILQAVTLSMDSNPVMVGIDILFLVSSFYISIMLSIKRAHDRNRSGYFVLIGFIPIILLWPAIELSFYKGTNGENRFGPDLLQTTTEPTPNADPV